MRFDADLWHLPLFADPSKAARPPTNLVSKPVLTSNPFALLTDDVSEPVRYPVLANTRWSQADIEEAHDSWCHPGSSMFDEITQQYPDLFPHDPQFRTAARKHRCPVCSLMKGARTYRQSKWMAEKKKKRSPKPPALEKAVHMCSSSPT